MMPYSNPRSAAQQASHDRVVALVAQERYNYKDKTTFTNPGAQKNKAAGSIDGQAQYPDIVVVDNSTGNPSIIAEIETEDSVDESEAQQWRNYGSLGLTFYLWVPNAKVNDAIQIINKKGIRDKVNGLRGYAVVNGKMQITDVWNAS